MKSKIALLFLALVFSSCSDNASVNFFDKNIANKEIECMKLVVFPPDQEIQNSLNNLYKFESNCEYKLEVSKKNGISCNSNQNLQKKAMGSFPSSYLKIQLNKGNQLLYSYYIDLKEDVKESDVKRAFNRLDNDLKLN